MKTIFKSGVDIKIGSWIMTVEDVSEYLSQNEDEELWWLGLREEIRSRRKWG